eukprot:878865_1
MGSSLSFISNFFGISSDSYSVESRTFADSYFRAIYRQTDKKQTIESVLKGLKQLQDTEFAQFFKKYANKANDDNKDDIHDDDNDEKHHQIDPLSAGDVAVKCWTLQRPKFYGALKC